MIGFDSPEVQAEVFEQIRAAFAAMQPAFEQIHEAARQVWAAIAKIVCRVMRHFARWWQSLPAPVRAQFKARSETVMRRKIRRYALAYAKRE